MLCGKPPFWGKQEEQLRRMKRETCPMSGPPWNHHSKESKHFINSIFKYNPRNRPTIDQLLSHKWLSSKLPALDKAVAVNVVQNMRNFNASNQFFSVCAAAVARQLDHHSLQDIHRVFYELDTNGDGVLDINEVRSGFKRIFGEGSGEVATVDEMFEALDLNGSGSLDYTEFCAAGIGDSVRMQEQALWAAFKSFDIGDENGKISADEIAQVLRNADVRKDWSSIVCEKSAKEIVSNFDADGDGNIDFEEFVLMMRKLAVDKKAQICSRDDLAGTLSDSLRRVESDLGLRPVRCNNKSRTPDSLMSKILKTIACQCCRA
jgi:calcium-dependent protein kinase